MTTKKARRKMAKDATEKTARWADRENVKNSNLRTLLAIQVALASEAGHRRIMNQYLRLLAGALEGRMDKAESVAKVEAGRLSVFRAASQQFIRAHGEELRMTEEVDSEKGNDTMSVMPRTLPIEFEAGDPPLAVPVVPEGSGGDE